MYRKMLTLMLLLLLQARLTPGSISEISASEIEKSPLSIMVTNQNFFHIPITCDWKQHRIIKANLFVSRDEGKSWHFVAEATLEKRFFEFHAHQDGSYCFLLQDVYWNGDKDPNFIKDVPPMLQVFVNTRERNPFKATKALRLRKEIRQLQGQLEKKQQHLQELEKQKK